MKIYRFNYSCYCLKVEKALDITGIKYEKVHVAYLDSSPTSLPLQMPRSSVSLPCYKKQECKLRASLERNFSNGFSECTL